MGEREVGGGGGRRGRQSVSLVFICALNLFPPQAPTPPRPAHPALLTTRADALSLYRAIWRATAAFTWPNERGVPWRDVLRASARGEFEEARTLTDPEAVARALVVGRDALGRALEKVREKAGEGRK